MEITPLMLGLPMGCIRQDEAYERDLRNIEETTTCYSESEEEDFIENGEKNCKCSRMVKACSISGREVVSTHSSQYPTTKYHKNYETSSGLK